MIDKIKKNLNLKMQKTTHQKMVYKNAKLTFLHEYTNMVAQFSS